MIKILILALSIYLANNALAQSIFEVRKNGQIVGYIAGGMHYGNAELLTKKSNQYENVISFVDSIYIEADPQKKIATEHRAKIYLNNGESLESLASHATYPCLQKLIQSGQLKKWKTDNILWSESGPAAFIYQFGQAQLKIKSGQENKFYLGESIDQKIIKIANQKNKPVYELEGFDKIFTTALAQKNEQLISVAENVCESASSSRIINLAKIDVSDFIEKFDSSNIDAIRESFIKSQKMMGWSDSFLYYNLTHRDKINAKHIDQSIFSMHSKKLIVVGIAHLGGNGLISNLRELGYEITIFNQ